MSQSGYGGKGHCINVEDLDSRWAKLLGASVFSSVKWV